MRWQGACKQVVGWKKARAWSPIEFDQILVRHNWRKSWSSLKLLFACDITRTSFPGYVLRSPDAIYLNLLKREPPPNANETNCPGYWLGDRPHVEQFFCWPE